MPSDMVPNLTFEERQGASNEALGVLERTSRSLEFLLASSRILAETGSRHAVTLQHLAEFVSQHFSAVCTISVVHPGEDVIRPIALHHHDESVVADIRKAFEMSTVRVGEGIVGKVMADGEEIVQLSVDEQFKNRIASFSPRIVPESFMYIPMITGRGVLGVLTLVRLVGDAHFTEEEVDIVRRLASNAALFLDNAWLREDRLREFEKLVSTQNELVQANQVTDFLLQVSRLLSDLRADREKLFFSLCELVASHFNVFCVIYLPDPVRGEMRPRAFHHQDLEVRSALQRVFVSADLENGLSTAIHVSRNGTPFIRLDAQHLDIDLVHMEPLLIPRAVGFWPLQRRESFGAICLCRLAGTETFSTTELQRAEQLAQHLSLFLENMLLHDRQQFEIDRRKAVEKRLARSESELRNILNAIPINISKVSKDFRYQFLNATYIKWGVHPKQMLGRHLSELLGDEQFERVMPTLERVLEGETIQYDDRITLQNGGTYYFTAILAPAYDEEGEIQGFYSCALDNTEKLAAEREMRVSEERYRSLLLHSGDAFCLHRLSGEILDVNSFATTLLGYSREELLTMNISSIDKGWLTPEYPRRLEKVSPDTPVTYETFIHHKDGRPIPVEVRFVKKIEEGEVLIQSLVRDRTEQRSQQEKLSKSEEWLRFLFNNVNDVIIGLHWDGTVHSINRPQQGYKESDVVGKSIYHNMEVVVADQLKSNLEMARVTGEPFEMIMRHLGLDGTSEWYLTRYCPVEARDMLICVSTNITHMKESELQMMNGMTLGQEEERKRLGAELHDGVGQILSSIALDLSELKHVPHCDEEIRNRIEEAGRRVTEAISEIRNISHDLMPGVLDNFGLEDAVRQICRNIRGRAGISVAFDGVDLAKGYPGALELHLYRIAQELMNNCMKHAHCSRIHVNLIDHGDSLSLSIEDDGLGFDPEKAVKGIGLKNIRSRVSILGGTLSVESSSTSGTLVIVDVPKR